MHAHVRRRAVARADGGDNEGGAGKSLRTSGVIKAETKGCRKSKRRKRRTRRRRKKEKETRRQSRRTRES